MIRHRQADSNGHGAGETEFDAIVDRYSKPVYNLVLRLLNDPEEAADVTQETFIRAYRSFSQFRGESSVYTWLYRIAVNLCKNRFKQRDGAAKIERLPLEASGPQQAAFSDRLADRETPDAVLQRKELIAQVERAISELPYDYRIVAVLRDLQGLSYQEIAEAADLSVDVVKTRLARARAMLRRRLGSYLAE